jgi:hypothetical protein
MPVYVAHYTSLDSNALRVKGSFEFSSTSKLGSKQNSHEARVCMLERFGNDAISWQIVKIEKKKARKSVIDGQLELDFRGPAPKKRKSRRKYL